MQAGARPEHELASMTLTVAEFGASPLAQAAGVPYSPLYDDVYHAGGAGEGTGKDRGGDWARAQHVFLAGNGLPGRWQQRTRFVILELGFGLGNNFLATWAAWHHDPARCEHLVFISIEKHPLRRDDLARVHGLSSTATGTAGPAADEGHPGKQPDGPDDADRAGRQALATRLVADWPTLTPGLHTLHFNEPDSAQRVSLILALGDVAEMLPALLAHADAFYLDGFAPSKNPQMWDRHLLSRLNRLAAPGATAASWVEAPGLRDALAEAGFVLARQPGFMQARYQPRYTAPAPAGGLWPAPPDAQRHALIIGAGLAGCSAALALCREGWRVTLIDQHAGPAMATSGNPGGLFHAIVHGDDGLHARTHRAAALATWRQVHPWIASGELPGFDAGLIRLDEHTSAERAHAVIEHLQLPADFVQWLSQPQAAELAGVPVPCGGWLLHQAGWLQPGAYAQLMLQEAAHWARQHGQSLHCVWGQAAERLVQADDAQWQAWGPDGLLAQAPTIVLCNANDAALLPETLPAVAATAALPLVPTRGQITEVQTAAHQRLPRVPIAGSGYALALSPQRLLCGATSQKDDPDTRVRHDDHAHNLGQAAQLGALPDNAVGPYQLSGRVGWRAVTPDRLPLIGALPLPVDQLVGAHKPRRLDQVRLIPRRRNAQGGLYTLSGLGSRGITWAALAGELLAHWVTGAPCPVEADLRDALDPARFLVREINRPP
jgi:tRNA 5-methylaminomethyl-2-thiouridine biosynthesis bifunctional protein